MRLQPLHQMTTWKPMTSSFVPNRRAHVQPPIIIMMPASMGCEPNNRAWSNVYTRTRQIRIDFPNKTSEKHFLHTRDEKHMPRQRFVDAPATTSQA